jgi:hypothetical protein
VALLLAAGFWTWLWGFAGLFLAVPMTVCAVVMGKYIPQLKFLQVLLGDEPVLKPHERLYQRLLSSNRDEADSVLHAALRHSSILEVCDAIIVPAMLRAEEDHDRGTLTDARRQTILEHINEWVDERLELMTPPRPGFASAQSSAPPAAVVCVPASGRADEIIAKLFQAAVIERNLTVRIIGRDAAEMFEGERGTRAIVISAVPPEAVTAARAVCKRMRAQNSQIPLFVGLWSPVGDLDRARQRLAAAGATQTVVTFAECLLQVETAMAPRIVQEPQPLAVAGPVAQA